MGMLKEQKMDIHEPTRQAVCEELVIGSVNFKAYDLGGHAQARKLWRQYMCSKDGIVFLVDAAEPDRFQESSDELGALLNSKELKDTPFLILGNKIDKRTAVNEQALMQALKIQDLCTGKTRTQLEAGIRPFEVFMCSIKNKQGFTQGFKWLSNFL